MATFAPFHAQLGPLQVTMARFYGIEFSKTIRRRDGGPLLQPRVALIKRLAGRLATKEGVVALLPRPHAPTPPRTALAPLQLS